MAFAGRARRFRPDIMQEGRASSYHQKEAILVYECDGFRRDASKEKRGSALA